MNQKNLYWFLVILFVVSSLAVLYDRVQASQHCGQGLAAEDIAGTCRAIPKATMGALEAVVDNTPGKGPALNITVTP